MCDYRDSLRPCHSFYSAETRRDSYHTEASWKSDVNVLPQSKPVKTGDRTRPVTPKVRSEHLGGCGEYYKRFELDEIPVKDENSSRTIKIESRKNSLTNSELEKLENKIYNNMSQELQTDEGSVSSLESNIKFFKTTVQEIFDKFNNCMEDFDLYKKRYEDILTKNRVDSITDMEDFIKDMMHHIMSSESSLSRESRNWMDAPNIEAKDKEDPSSTNILSEQPTEKLLEGLQSVVEAYKNDNYMTDSTFEDNNPFKLDNPTKTEETFNIYLLSSVPYVQIKMNDRNLLSEINIKDQNHKEEIHVASAENLKSLTAKKQEVERYIKQQNDHSAQDREIPVKVSFAKKNIYLNEDFTHERDKEDNRSFMSRICSYICKKFRKS